MIEEERAAVVAEARTWIGTPFAHAHRTKGVGVDCAQFCLGVYRSLGLVPVIDVAQYSPDWFLHEEGGQPILKILREHCTETDEFSPGDLIVFRFGRAIAHLGIVTDFPGLVHADRSARVVLEDRAGATDSLGVRLAGCWTLNRWILPNE